MQCAKCGSEYIVVRDENDDLLRRLCPCEVGQACQGCKRGKVTHALLTRTGEVTGYACEKHGSPEAATWLPPSAAPTPGRAAAQALLEGKLKVRAKKDAPAAPEAPRQPYGRIKQKVELFAASCSTCPRKFLTSLAAPFCAGCGTRLTLSESPSGTYLDGVFVESGPRGTSLILTAMSEGAEERDFGDLLVTIPRQ